MSKLVDASSIERIVGATRHETDHLGRAVSVEKTVYILHSRECKDSGTDLRTCPYSEALDRGIKPDTWTPDTVVALRIVDGLLVSEEMTT